MFSNGELKFGEKMYFAIFAVRGDISVDTCKHVVSEIIRICGMKTGDLQPVCWRVTPLGAESIGESFTYVQPILTSMIACDQWEELNGAWWVVASCSPFKYKVLKRYMKAVFPKGGGKYFEMKMSR